MTLTCWSQKILMCLKNCQYCAHKRELLLFPAVAIQFLIHRSFKKHINFRLLMG